MYKHLFGYTNFNVLVLVVFIIKFIIDRILKKRNKIKNYFIVLIVPLLMYIGKWYTSSNGSNGSNGSTGSNGSNGSTGSNGSNGSRDSVGSSTTELSDLFSLNSSN